MNILTSIAHKNQCVYMYAGEDLGHPGLWRPTEFNQGQEDSDWSLQEGGADRVASHS